MQEQKGGFTLVELSIVLVIIGLLTGGILVAQSMILTAGIEMQIRSLQQYEIAINNFKLNYKYFPGDAPLFNPPGNGDGAFGFGGAGNGVGCNGVYSNYENNFAFAHLSQAQMLSSTYLPYSPTSCGGTMTSGSPGGLAGTVYPYTQLDGNAAKLTGYSKYGILPGINNYSSFLLTLTTSASYVIPMETKMGSTPFPVTSSTSGLVNAWGVGMCEDGYGNAVSCNASNAGYGNLYYFLSPI